MSGRRINSARRWPHPPLKGCVDIRRVRFPSLKGNALNDSWERPVVVYLPPEYEKSKKKYPVIIALSGFLGTGLKSLSVEVNSLNLIEQADALISKGLPPFLIAIPDAFTYYGGSQYLNSSAIGNYEDMISDDFLSWIDANYRVLPERAVMGKSSGGYGALRLGMRHPDLFQAVACHSGDMYFEWCYKPDFPKAAQTIHQEGSVSKFLNRIWGQEKFSPKDVTALNIIAMSAAYSPNPKAPLGFDLPFDVETAELREEIWKKWLKFDPVFLVESYASNLKKLKGLYLDCGNQDEYFLHFGARILTQKLKSLNVPCHYEEFPDGHRDITYRYSYSLPRLSESFKKRTHLF